MTTLRALARLVGPTLLGLAFLAILVALLWVAGDLMQHGMEIGT